MKGTTQRPITPRLCNLEIGRGEMDGPGIRTQVLSCPSFMLLLAAEPEDTLAVAGMLNDMIAHDWATLANMVSRIGLGRVVLGSAFPFDMGLEQPVATVRDLGQSAEASKQVLSGNARALLGLSGAYP